MGPHNTYDRSTNSSNCNTVELGYIEVEIKVQKGKMMIMIMKNSGSQVDSPVAEGKRKVVQYVYLLEHFSPQVEPGSHLRRKIISVTVVRGPATQCIMCVCVLLCFIIPILGNRYGPGVNSLRQ